MSKTTVSVVMILVFFAAGITHAAPVAKQLPFTKSVALGSGSYTFRFSLWTAETGGAQVWSEEQTLVLGTPVINTALGKATTLSTVDFSQQLWVQTEQKTETTYAVLGPRDVLTATPYALWSDIGTDNTKVSGEKLRILRGTVLPAGTPSGGTGYTVARPATGIYDVTFQTQFGDIPTIVVTQHYPDSNDFTSTGGETLDNCVIVAVSAAKARIKCGNGSGNADNRRFEFIAVGPR